MAALTSPSEQAADLLQSLSLDHRTKTAEISESRKKAIKDENGTVMHHLGHVQFDTGHSPYSPSPAIRYNSQLYGTQHYQYPTGLYNPPPSSGTCYFSNQVKHSHGESSTPTLDHKVSLSSGRPLGNPNNAVNIGNMNRNDGQKPSKTSNQFSSSNVNGSSGRGVVPTTGLSPLGYRGPTFRYDEYQSQYPLLDASTYSGPFRHAAGTVLSSSLNSHPTGPTSGWGHSSGFMNMTYPTGRIYGQFGNRADAYFGSFGYNSWTNGTGWVVVDSKYKPRGHGYGNENVNSLSELNRGPRAKGIKIQKELEPVTATIEGGRLLSSESSRQANFFQVLNKEQYNREDFPGVISEAKFFVIKSYSEDDVHKSIKYNVWSSTPNGNKKLDAAYLEAKENHRDCPVYLLFSVNTSGQFVGLAEMVGPVDFNRSVEYWQQDKWIGCFPVKWHIIKDVPNSSLRHITLENNENKPVTNSRDTQEVTFEKGMQILKILKGHNGKTSILDDFGFYAARERIMQEKRAKQKIQKKAANVLDGKAVDIMPNDKDTALSIGKDSSQKYSNLDLAKPVSRATIEGE